MLQLLPFQFAIKFLNHTLFFRLLFQYFCLLALYGFWLIKRLVPFGRLVLNIFFVSFSLWIYNRFVQDKVIRGDFTLKLLFSFLFFLLSFIVLNLFLKLFSYIGFLSYGFSVKFLLLTKFQSFFFNLVKSWDMCLLF